MLVCIHHGKSKHVLFLMTNNLAGFVHLQPIFGDPAKLPTKAPQLLQWSTELQAKHPGMLSRQYLQTSVPSSKYPPGQIHK